jgi:Zn-dependent protease
MMVPLISFREIVELIIMSAILGYIFMGKFIARPKTVYDMMHPKRFNMADFKFSLLVVAPAIVLHELAHKFVAMAYGLTATFKMFGFGLGVGLVLKLINAPFILVAPGYVEIPIIANAFAYRLIAFAGPAMNLLLWIISSILLKKLNNLNRTQMSVLQMTKMINMILFFFNMIPFGPFDGAKVFHGPPAI